MANNSVQDFNSTYTNANTAADSTPYDAGNFRSLVQQLKEADNGSISQVAPAIVAAMLCAQHRGDAVPKLFNDLAEGKGVDEIKTLFLDFKHAIDLTWAFIGLPHCIPACLGLVNELSKRNISVNSELDRPLLSNSDWSAKGTETYKAIYRAAGNPEVGRMLAEAFPEISHIVNVAVFGFLIGGSEGVQNLPLSEITIAGAIAAMGATRQARSHFKGCIGLGLSALAVQAVLSTAEQVAAWNGKKLPNTIDMAALVAEARANLGKEESL